jgi:hypothetical protein
MREKLLARLRKTLVGTKDPQLAANLALELEDFVRTNRVAQLRPMVNDAIGGLSLSERVHDLVTRLPDTHRANWFVDTLSEECGLVWADATPDAGGTLVLPADARESILRRFEKLEEEQRASHDQQPEFEGYADLLEDELDRLGRSHEALATRLLTRRFQISPDQEPVLFHARLVHEGLEGPKQIVAFLEEHLGIRWSDRKTKAVVTPAEPVEVPTRAYSPEDHYVLGDRVEHTKFGVGTVVEVEDGRAKIRFTSGERRLVAR